MRPALWFDLGLLRAPGVNTDARYHAALPNLLVGAGLLFTFLGLAAALSTAGGVVSGGPDQRNIALKVLLDTASFKFVTSLVGLLLSIIYALWRKSRLRLVDRALDRFLEVLEDRMPLLTPAALQAESNTLLEQQQAQFEQFSTELAVNIGQAFDRAFDARLGEHIAPLTAAMERLASGMSSRNEDTMQKMLDGFLGRLQGGAGDRMQDAAGALEGLVTQLQGLQSGLGEATARMAQSSNDMAARMSEGAETMLTRLAGWMDDLEKTLRGAAAQAGDELRVGGVAGAEALRDLLERAGGAIAAAAADAATRLAQAGDEAGSAVQRGGQAAGAALDDAGALFGERAEGFAKEVAALAAAADGVAVRIAELEQAAREAAAPLAATAADLKTVGQTAQASVQPLAQAAEAVGGVLDEMAGAAQRFESAQAATGRLAEALTRTTDRFAGIDEELASTLTALQDGLKSFAAEVTGFVRNTDQNLAKAANQLGHSIKDLQNTLEDIQLTELPRHLAPAGA